MKLLTLAILSALSARAHAADAASSHTPAPAPPVPRATTPGYLKQIGTPAFPGELKNGH